jgi:HEAT repeat protein
MSIKWSLITLLAFLLFTQNNLSAKIQAKKPQIDPLLIAYSKEIKGKSELLKLKKETIEKGAKSVPVLIKVMKSGKFPEKNRWMATFLLGRIMGAKSAPFIARFVEHPNWIMRMASLKTLLALKQKKLGNLFVKALKDKSLIVRHQALENIRRLQIKEHAASVWAMLYDKSNYYSKKKKLSKRTNIIKEVIRTVGELKYQKAKAPLLSMIQKKKYQDIFDDIDYSLAQIVGKHSPKGDRSVKRLYWKRVGLGNTKI